MLSIILTTVRVTSTSGLEVYRLVNGARVRQTSQPVDARS